MRLGLGSFTYTWAIGVPGYPPAQPLTHLGLLDEAVRLGVDLVQVADNLALDTVSAAQLDRFAGRARDAGISVEVGTRGIEAGHLQRHLELARRFGAPFLRVVIDRGGDEPTPGETFRRLSAVLPAFRDAGVRLAIENHDRFPCRTLATLVEDLGLEVAGICLDTVNSLGALETPETVVSTLGPYTLCLHVKDFTVRRVAHQMGFVVEGCAAGSGRLDVPWLFRTLRRLACQPFNAILETWVTPGPDLAETIARERGATEAGVAFLKPLVASLR